MESGRKHLSISQLNMMSRCGEQYRRRYVMGEKIPPGISLVVGRAVDGSVNRNLQRVIDGAGLMSFQEVLDTAAGEFDNSFKETEVMFTPDESIEGVGRVVGAAKDKAIRLSSLHATYAAPSIRPTHIQREVRVEIPDSPMDLIGYIDVQEGTTAIRDTKTAAKTPPANTADKSDQLTIYAMMGYVLDGAIPDRLVLDYLVDTKVPKYAPFISTRTLDDFNPVLRRIEAALMALEKGVFIPAQETDWGCSPRWCGYWETCQYTKRQRPTN